MKKYIIFILMLGLISSFILGVYLHKLNKVEDQIAFEAEFRYEKSENVIKEAEAILIETSSSEIKTSPNTKLIKKIYYNDCDHIVETTESLRKKLINKNESEFQIEYIGWEIQKFTPNEIVIYKEIYDYCNEHYLLKDAEGEIVIYALDKYDNEKTPIKETGIQTKYLSEVDIENLKKRD